MGPRFELCQGRDRRISVIVRIEAFIRKLLRLLSPEAWMRRLLNLPKIIDKAAAPGLVMIQIDGLGWTQFKRAEQEGTLPFLSRLSRKEGYRACRLYSGLPSNTPSVQGHLFYGVKGCVPAFNFRDSRSGRVVHMFSPDSAAMVEQRLRNKGEALLKEGSAYGNIFTGGAKEPHFCASSIGWGGFLNGASPLGLPLTILLNLHIFFRALFLIVVELVLAVCDLFRGVFSGNNFLEELRFTLLRVAVCVLLREISAAGASIDIHRGLPVIHLNLAGYDEQAHHRGPKSTFAHWSLRGIDSAIGKVWRAAQRSPRREYTVFIYSDHGQEETLSYENLTGRTIDKAVREILEKMASVSLRESEPRSNPILGRADLLRNIPPRRDQPSLSENQTEPSQAIVTSMGPVGHIYLPQKLSAEKCEAIALALVREAQIPIVMVPRGPGQAVAWNARGKFLLPEEAGQVLETRHPFFGDVTRDLMDLCHHPDSGDLLIFGWRKGPKPLTFCAEQGSHAGPGPEETSAFALLPMGAMPSPSKEMIHVGELREASFRALGRTCGDAVAPVHRELPKKERPFLRVMTYNVHGCLGRDGRISPTRIAGVIANHEADVIALQELETGEQTDQAGVIAKKLSLSVHFYPTLFTRKGRRGNAILSKFPMRLVRNGNLPSLFQTPFLEPRAALWVEIERHGIPVQIMNTHLSLSSQERLLQMQALCGPEWLKSPQCQGPIVFCGDLNALPKSKVCLMLGQILINTHWDLNGHQPLKTLPSFFPLGLVDHIFVGPGLKTTKIQVPQTELERMSSDHLPLVVDLAFP